MKKIVFGALVAYFGIIGVIIAAAINSEKKDSFISFHLRQAVFITSIILCLNFMNLQHDNTTFRIITWTLSLSLKCIGIYSVTQYKMISIPVIGNLAQKIFKSL
ncbi:hypothetical protein RF683_03250 [Flavobacterium sp. 20NA77.7]|uniref:Uncharacterized protein n=1 Tax=Flavobacterium nakdongensis TaxID=3073563 RepID=A0ABY9RBF2_9FLAO|nr:hypothetical protein [Flavobacterium sp. 20NA77.7]WMW78479.1 hypothetical protein RF683_03250 [Flavobacterium sp. 20NA77.7]